jgi:hypothetical protein
MADTDDDYETEIEIARARRQKGQGGSTHWEGKQAPVSQEKPVLEPMMAGAARVNPYVDEITALLRAAGGKVSSLGEKNPHRSESFTTTTPSAPTTFWTRLLLTTLPWPVLPKALGTWPLGQPCLGAS